MTAESTLSRLRRLHVVATEYPYVGSQERYETQPYCPEDGEPWPCDASRLLDIAEAARAVAEGTPARLRREHVRGRCTHGQGHARHAGPDCLGCEVPWPCTESLLLDVAEAARDALVILAALDLSVKWELHADIKRAIHDTTGRLTVALAALDTREAAPSA